MFYLFFTLVFFFSCRYVAMSLFTDLFFVFVSGVDESIYVSCQGGAAAMDVLRYQKYGQALLHAAAYIRVITIEFICFAPAFTAFRPAERFAFRFHSRECFFGSPANEIALNLR